MDSYGNMHDLVIATMKKFWKDYMTILFRVVVNTEPAMNKGMEIDSEPHIEYCEDGINLDDGKIITHPVYKVKLMNLDISKFDFGAQSSEYRSTDVDTMNRVTMYNAAVALMANMIDKYNQTHYLRSAITICLSRNSDKLLNPNIYLVIPDYPLTSDHGIYELNLFL